MEATSSDPHAESPSHTDPTLAEVVARARKAQASWAALEVGERAYRLRALAPKALARSEEIARIIHSETGKPEVEALLAEVLSIADLVDHWTHHIESLLEPSEIELDPFTFPSKSGRTERVPRGLIALITPWNYPVILPLRHLIPALLSGNAVIFKPSEVTPEAASLIASLFDGILPVDLLTIVQGGADVGQALIHSGVDAVAFTGSLATGRHVALACAQHLLPCSLELGGKDAAIVLGDANIERAARGIVWGAFTNAGQNCASIERVYVVRSVADKLIERVVTITKSLRANHDYGPITTQAQLELVSMHLAEAVHHGAEVLTGGPPEDDSRLFSPTVVRVKDEAVELLRTETFGPILPIVVVDDEEQAITRANDTPYGLTVSIWTRRHAKARTMAARLRAGVVTINTHGFTAALPMAPWTGVGHSGHGVVNSAFALDGYTRPRFVLTDRRRGVRELWWYPYDDTLRRLALQMARMRGGAGFFGRIAAFFALLLLLPRRLFGK
jgi:acyl-CoA reductase-like NAD-dependent aldehyde dehydrogenase